MNGNKMPTIHRIGQQALFGYEIDELAPLPSEPRARRGDLWALGDHLLLCGDATNAADVQVLLDATAEPPYLMVTDPPYGAGHSKRMAHFIREQKFRAKWGRRNGLIQNDEVADWGDAFALCPAPVAYIWHSGLKLASAYAGIENAGYILRQQIVWVKNIFALGRTEYHWKHELCVYAVRTADLGRGGAMWQGGRAQSSVWDIPAIQSHNTPTYDYYGSTHPNQKPVECFARPLRNHAAPVVIDMFAGSGTIFIAAERERRAALGIEIMPEYIDMAITRWEDYTGKTARLIERTEEVCNGRQIKGQGQAGAVLSDARADT